MPQFLLELFSEEIPARMQARAAADLERRLNDALLAAGFLPEAVKAFAAPRRLAVVAEGLPARTPDVREERRGPKVGAPEAAVQGFLRAAGLRDLSAARVVADAKKGEFYVADIVRPGRPTREALAEIAPALITGFAWPKSMRWGEGTLTWVRPLHRVLALFDGEVVAFHVGGIESGDLTEGHRVHGPGPFAVKDVEDYATKLRAAGVILDREERKATILADARTLCAAQGLELVEDEGLLEEVAGLVDLPVALIGDMDRAFLDLPAEVIRLTMRVNQKYFAVRDPATGGLAPKFVVVANVRADDGGAAIVHGNARVLTARLNDARYFWDLDRKTPLADRFAKLESIVFHEKLGSVADKARRVASLARDLAPLVGADPDLCEQAATLAKCDLATEMVGEFPELQGVMGRYYALEQGAPAAVADAIRDHYKPLGPSDAVPAAPVSVAVALADKLDTLTGFFWIGETPTGSGDPYALRRAALGVQRILIENELPIYVRGVLEAFADKHPIAGKSSYSDFSRDMRLLIAFMDDRLRVALRGQGVRPDVVAAIGIGDAGYLGERRTLALTRLAYALQAFTETVAAADLIAGLKRAANILRAEEKKEDAPIFWGVADPALFRQEEERALHAALGAARAQADAALAGEDFAAAMAALAALRTPIDRFFEAVLVNDPDPDVRRNRLALLGEINDATRRVADFARIEG